MDGMRFDKRQNTPLKNQALTFRNNNNFMSVDDSTSFMSSPANGQVRASMKVGRVWDNQEGSKNLISKYAQDEEPLDNIDSISDS